LIAAGVAVTLAVPIALFAAHRAGSRNPAGAAATPAPAAPEQAATVEPGRPESTIDPVAAAAGSASVPNARPSVSVSASAPAVAPVSGSAAPSGSPPAKPAVSGKANPSGANLALNATATASASEGNPWLPANAVDGDTSTRWSSAFSDPQWIRVDLGRNWQISEITLVWEHAYGAAYRVETSVDGKTWKRAWTTTAGTGGTVRIAAEAVARHVRMYGTKRSGIYGYSLIEFEVR
jgi:hypothetical protein